MTTLVAWVWQGLAIACATAAILACAPRLNAATRHAIWWLACAAVLALPLAYALVEAPSSSAVAPATVPLPTAPDRLLAAVLVAWAVFGAAGLLRVVGSVRTVMRLKRAGEPLDAGVVARVFASSEAASLRVSTAVPAACALGLGRPVILLSRTLVDALEDDDLEAIVRHEHAHLARRDDWWQMLQALVLAVAGWHPAIWIIGRRIVLEREAACDDHVVAHTRAPRAYARALVQAAESRQGWFAAVDRLAIPGAAVSPSALRRRVRRLLDGRIDRASRPGLRTTLTALVTLTIAVTAAARVPAMVVFVDIASLLPGVDLSSTRRAVPALASLATASDLQSASATRTARVDRDGPAAQSPLPVPAVPVAVGTLPAPAGAGIVTSAVLAGTPLAPPDAGPPAASTPPASWSAVGHLAAAGGQRLGDGGVAAGASAKNAGLSVGRFFSRAGKRIAGGL